MAKDAHWQDAHKSATNSSISEVPLPLVGLFDADVAIADAVPSLVDDQLYPEERQYIARAVPKRRAEFGTARLCARRALGLVGVKPCSLVPNPDRSPFWPNGVVGSISHTDNYCAVVVTKSVLVSGVGLDVEQDTPLNPELETMICTANERCWLDTQARQERGRLGKLFFSAKEAFYKCQYTKTRMLLDFQDVDICFDLEANTFRVTRIYREGLYWNRILQMKGRLLRTRGLIVTAATMLLT